jgi:hypothetical protein
MRRNTLSAALLVTGLLVAGRRGDAQKCGQPFEVAAGTPSSDVAHVVVDQMFEQITLKAAQQSKAVNIVAKFIDDQANASTDSATRARQVDSLTRKRDADLLAILTNDADKAKLAACLKKVESTPVTRPPTYGVFRRSASRSRPRKSSTGWRPSLMWWSSMRLMRRA